MRGSIRAIQVTEIQRNERVGWHKFPDFIDLLSDKGQRYPVFTGIRGRRDKYPEVGTPSGLVLASSREQGRQRWGIRHHAVVCQSRVRA
jgi:hypothetical protein